MSTSFKEAQLFIDDNGFLWIRFLDNYLIERDDIEDHARAIIKFCKSKKRGFVLDSRNVYGIIEPEAKEFMAKYEPVNSLCAAQAILVNNLPIRLQAKSYIQYHSPLCKSNIFTKEDNAVSWLKSQIG